MHLIRLPAIVQYQHLLSTDPIILYRCVNRLQPETMTTSNDHMFHEPWINSHHDQVVSLKASV